MTNNWLIAAGDYIFMIVHTETGTNRTMMEIRIKATIKNKGLMDMSMLNMG